MFRNYLKIALRNLRKHKLYAAINVLGLAMGIAFCALIFLYVQDELTFNAFHEKAERIFRVNQVTYAPEGGIAEETPWQPFPFAAALEADIPGVEETVRLIRQPTIVRREDTAFEETVLFADPALLDMFSFPLVRGAPETALADINTVVLTESTAKKYFGDSDPIGETIEVRFGGFGEPSTFHTVVVTGIAKDIPGPSSIRFDFLMPFGKLPATLAWIRRREQRWNASSFFVYALLREGTSAETVEAKLPAFRAKHQPDEAQPRGYALQPLLDIHLDPSVDAGLVPPSDPRYSYLLGGLALFILLIACINFTTLTIGRSSSRAREIGVRKTVGAQRPQLMLQFWGEAILLSLIALVFGIALAELVLPTFNNLAAKTLHFNYFDNATTMLALISLMLATGLVAGSYPALLLSRVRPIEMLQQRLRLGGSNVLTKSLVVVQFALSAALVVATLIMLRQLTYLQEKNLGFDDEQVIVIPTQRLDGASVLKQFQQHMGSHRGVQGLTAANMAFPNGYSRESWAPAKGVEQSAYTYRVESNYLDVLGMELVAGRSFSPDLATDSTKAVLVNEALVRQFGWTDPIGQELTGFYSDPVVVGVFRDVHFRSLHETVEPMVLYLFPGWGLQQILVRVAPGLVPETLADLRTTWAGIAPDIPFKYSFLDDDLNRLYASEQRWSRIIGYGAGFAILIACLGLFGLAALTVVGRTKEIGIRKVLGATVSGIMFLLSKDLLKLIALALVIGTPLAYVGMHRWLANFAYQAEIGVGIFVLTGALTLAIAWLMVSYHALRAALTDPVKSLRYE